MEEKSTQKKSATKKSGKNNENFFQKISREFKNIIAEFKKIVWPPRHTLAKQSFTVILVSLGAGAIIYAYDLIYDFLFSLFL